jgi:hypothetical protein
MLEGPAYTVIIAIFKHLEHYFATVLWNFDSQLQVRALSIEIILNQCLGKRNIFKRQT